MGKGPCQIRRADGAVVAKRQQHKQRLLQRAGAVVAEREQRCGLGIEHHDVGFAAHLQRADTILNSERFGAAERGEISSSTAVIGPLFNAAIL